MTTITLLVRLLKRNGIRLMLTFGSLLVGAVALATILGMVGSVEQFFTNESRTLIGGDITIENEQPFNKSDPGIFSLPTGVALSEKIETLVVVQSGKPPTTGRLSSLLVSLKVVDQEYPLYGTLGTQSGTTKAPREDQIFVAKDVLARMGLTVGERLVVGKEQFTISDVILNEPDRVGGSFRLGPLVMISSSGWKQTGIDQKQSRTEHVLSIRFPAGISSEETRTVTQSIKESFPRPTYRVSVAADGPTSLLRILDAAERFFFTLIVLALFLVVVNIRLNLIFFLASFQKTIAIMRALGIRRGQLFTLFLSLLLVVSLFAGVVGGLLGNIVAERILPFAEGFIDGQLPSVPLFGNILPVALFTMLLCAISAFGFLIRVTSIDPKMLLLGYGTEHGKFSTLMKEIPSLLLTLLGLFGGVYYLTNNLLVASLGVAGIALAFAALFFIARALITLSYKVRFTLPFSLRSISTFLKHQGLVGTTAIASLTIALASMFTIALIEENLLGNLKTEFRSDAPNIYLIDVQEDQLPKVRDIMGPSWKEFSVLRARFTLRDGYDIQANLEKEDPEMRREFNVTEGVALIEGERLVSGVWHGNTGKREVSVEKDFAERAKLSLGTQVQFVAQGVLLDATVTSIREVTATNGLPFFFLVFSPDVLAKLPRSSFGYAYVPEEKIAELQNTITSTFPNISSIPTTQILETVGKVVGALSVAVVATAVPALLLGLILILAMLAISARERGKDLLVFTAFGARLQLLFLIFLLESGGIILFSGLFAAVIAHSGAFILNQFVFNFTRFYFSWDTVYLFLSILIATLAIAYILARRFIKSSPAELLRKN